MNNLVLLLMMYVQGKDWIRACELYDIHTTIIAQYIIDHTSIEDINDLIFTYSIGTNQDINKYCDKIVEIERNIAEAY